MKRYELGNNVEKCGEVFDFFGYPAYTRLLCKIFNIHPLTVVNRLDSTGDDKWDLEFVFLVKPGSGINRRTLHLLNREEYQKRCRDTIRQYFKENPDQLIVLSNIKAKQDLENTLKSLEN